MEEHHKLLLVDNEPDILEFLSFNLRRQGYTVFTAPDDSRRNIIRYYTPACAKSLVVGCASIYLILKTKGKVYFTLTSFPHCIPGFHLGDDWTTRIASAFSKG